MNNLMRFWRTSWTQKSEFVHRVHFVVSCGCCVSKPGLGSLHFSVVEKQLEQSQVELSCNKRALSRVRLVLLMENIKYDKLNTPEHAHRIIHVPSSLQHSVKPYWTSQISKPNICVTSWFCPCMGYVIMFYTGYSQTHYWRQGIICCAKKSSSYL